MSVSVDGGKGVSVCMGGCGCLRVDVGVCVWMWVFVCEYGCLCVDVDMGVSV